ncbi:MAG: glycogen/starch synthase, partial [Thermoplasmatales archaeon]|nr:glycogen/starch synthase [Thermoplasmatales archaeon]
MKIVHFSWEFLPVIFGGLGTFATEIIQKQVAMGNEVTVFSLNEQNKLKTSDSWKGITVYRQKNLDIAATLQLCTNQELRSWGTNFQFFSDVMSYNLFSASKLINLLTDNGGKSFDIIDAHDWLGIMGGIVAKKELDIPLMFHVHSTEAG